VHVIGAAQEAVFKLNCAHGPVEIRENYGFAERKLTRILLILTENLVVLCRRGQIFMAMHSNFELANERAEELQKTLPRAVSAHYDRASGKIVIDLSSKLTVSFSARDAQGLEHAKPSQLDEIEITPSGSGLHFPKLDADLYVPALLEGFLGSEKWMAARLGERGGRSQSRAKKAASRANGRLGGRPKRSKRVGA
jgi:hypothetical protein